MVSLTRVALTQIARQQGQLTRAIGAGEQQIASGQRIVRASDAPGDWAELSSIARERSASDATLAVIATAQGRAQEAERSLAGMTEAMTHAQELLVAAGGLAGSGVGSAAIVAELTAIRAELAASLGATTGDGRTVFDGAVAEPVIVAAGRAEQVVPRGVDVGTLADGRTLDSLLADAIAAAGSGDPGQRAIALAGVTAGVDHIVIEQARQGVRLVRLEQADGAVRSRDIARAERQSALGDTDIAAAITRVQSLLTQQSASRAILAQTSRETLFDLLR
jgi:flagellar hook-associated protein 3 FlgL